MQNFTYHQPTTLAEAKQLLLENEDAKILSGGMTLFPTMKMRLAAPSDLIDLSSIADLRGIQVSDTEVKIGAMTTHSEVAYSRTLRSELAILPQVASLIGDAQVRNRGTIGGSLSNSDPAADYPAAALGLDAVIITDGREIAAADYFQGLFETALDEHEILTAVRFAKPVRAAYIKFPNPASRYAVVGVLVAQMADGSSRVAVTGAAACAYRELKFEQALNHNFSVTALGGLESEATDLNQDVFASADYRRHLIGVMARRAVKQMDE
ncbi:MAG: xanthine dehydrogenase family protein subunit M [Gammaproteobacteria bacterium]